MRLALILLSALLMAGCATTNTATAIKYSYDMGAGFPAQKTYAWGPSATGLYARDPLLEANVRALADRDLAQKGFSMTSGSPDLRIAMAYEAPVGINGDSYQLRALNLYIYRADTRDMVWRGSAIGTVSTDADSGELKRIVLGILANFPPKASASP